jgi:hypothetical protein
MQLTLTGKTRAICYGNIFYEDVHPSEVVLDPLKGCQYFGLVADVTFDGVQSTCHLLQRFGQFPEESKAHKIRRNVDIVTNIRVECVS